MDRNKCGTVDTFLPDTLLSCHVSIAQHTQDFPQGHGAASQWGKGCLVGESGSVPPPTIRLFFDQI